MQREGGKSSAECNKILGPILSSNKKNSKVDWLSEGKGLDVVTPILSLPGFRGQRAISNQSLSHDRIQQV